MADPRRGSGAPNEVGETQYAALPTGSGSGVAIERVKRPPLTITLLPVRILASVRLILSLLAVLSLGSAPNVLAATAEWQPGPDAILDNTYAGSIDLPAAGATVSATQAVTVAGWVVDRAADGWAGIDTVHVYDGLAGQGGSFLGQAVVALPRADVAQVLEIHSGRTPDFRSRWRVANSRLVRTT